MYLTIIDLSIAYLSVAYIKTFGCFVTMGLRLVHLGSN